MEGYGYDSLEPMRVKMAAEQRQKNPSSKIEGIGSVELNRRKEYLEEELRGQTEPPPSQREDAPMGGPSVRSRVAAMEKSLDSRKEGKTMDFSDGSSGPVKSHRDKSHRGHQHGVQQTKPGEQNKGVVRMGDVGEKFKVIGPEIDGYVEVRAENGERGFLKVKDLEIDYASAKVQPSSGTDAPTADDTNVAEQGFMGGRLAEIYNSLPDRQTVMDTAKQAAPFIASAALGAGAAYMGVGGGDKKRKSKQTRKRRKKRGKKKTRKTRNKRR